MTADVNVTEKVARAREFWWAHHLMGKRSHRNARRSSFDAGFDAGFDAALSDPEVLAGVAGVLREHGLVRAAYRDSSYGPGIVCRCGAVVDQALDETTQETQAHHEAAEVVKWLRGQG